MHHIAHACVDNNRSTPDEWFVQGENCNEIDLEEAALFITPVEIVFTVLMPHKGLEMSRWHQFIVGVMSIEIVTERISRKYCRGGLTTKFL